MSAITTDSKLVISLSGTTCLNRTWDGGANPNDYNDPWWKRFCQALKEGRSVRRGRGYQIIITLSKEDAAELAEYLKDWGEIYEGPGMEEGCAAEGRALTKDGARIQADLDLFFPKKK